MKTAPEMIEEAIASLDAEANAPTIAMLREVLAALASTEMADKGPEKKAEDPAAVAMAAEEQKTLRAQARTASDLAERLSAVTAEVTALRAEKTAEARARVLSAHRTRGALSPALEADKVFMADLDGLDALALDRVLSKLPGAPAAVKVATPTALGAPEPTDQDLEMGRRFGVADTYIKAAATAPRR